jgi:two-component system chemotaxis response regulator CheY
MHILLAEDDYINRQYLYTVLSHYGQVRLANNGEEAIESYTQAIKENKRFDVICLDINMPETDGISVLQTIRNMESTQDTRGSKPAKIVMMTGHAEKSTVMQAVKLGCDGFLLKPVDKEKLFTKLSEIGIRMVSH